MHDLDLFPELHCRIVLTAGEQSSSPAMSASDVSSAFPAAASRSAASSVPTPVMSLFLCNHISIRTAFKCSLRSLIFVLMLFLFYFSTHDKRFIWIDRCVFEICILPNYDHTFC